MTAKKGGMKEYWENARKEKDRSCNWIDILNNRHMSSGYSIPYYAIPSIRTMQHVRSMALFIERTREKRKEIPFNIMHICICTSGFNHFPMILLRPFCPWCSFSHLTIISSIAFILITFSISQAII